MGLFSRKKSEQATRSTSRAATSSEAQAAELRGRARRRLIGALVLVLTAVIIVPMMFDDTTTEQAETPVVLPAIVPPLPEPDLATTTPFDGSVDEPVLDEGSILLADGTHVESGVDGTATIPVEPVQDEPTSSAETAPPATSSEPVPEKPEPKPEAKPEPKPEPARETPPQRDSTPAKPDTRTDDGSVALALLEGREPPSRPSGSVAPAQTQGTFVLQIAAYSTEADAQSRRSALVDAGVTNAYVERGVSNDRTTYRLRVGSFPTRDAAQAAQARLRALGYDNSLLLTQ